MPFVRKGRVVYKRVGRRLVKKGASKTIAKAKRYLRALYAHSKDIKL